MQRNDSKKPARFISLLQRPGGKPEALEEWEVPEPFWRRLGRAVTIPIAAGAVVLVLSIIVSIAFLWLAPQSGHSVAPAQPGPDEHLTDKSANPEQDAWLTDAETAHDSAHESGTVFIHVVGEVEDPGVVELAAGARVEAAIAAAGGPTGSAALAGINLARVVVDGEQIIVPNHDEAARAEADAAASTEARDATGTDGTGNLGGTVNINTASAQDLVSLPGIGPALADRIIEYRTVNGPFQQETDLLQVSGIGVKKYEALAGSVRIS